MVLVILKLRLHDFTMNMEYGFRGVDFIQVHTPLTTIDMFVHLRNRYSYHLW